MNTKEEYAAALRIQTWVAVRQQKQITRLQSLLGITENFEEKVVELWKEANKS